MLIKEDNYQEMMDTIAVPYLKERQEELWFERVPGKKIHCMHYTQEDAKAVIVISHGFTESIPKYQEVIYRFMLQGYTVYMHEHCGHGYSYRLVEDPSLVHIINYSDYIKDLIYVGHKAKLDNDDLPLYLFAHSMGGGIAAATAAKAPKLFEKVILSSPMIRPETGNVPWEVTQSIAGFKRLIGKADEYIAGATPFDPDTEVFEYSCGTSEARFDYYKQIRIQDEKYFTKSASYGWIYGAGVLNKYLQKEAYKLIEAPVLLFQASLENVVSKEEQCTFIDKINAEGRTEAKLVVIEDAKHEIFNSHDDVFEDYLQQIFEFFG